MNKRLRVDDYLGHMLNAIERIERYVSLVADERAFEQDTLVQDGIVKNIGVLGEAAKNITRVAPDFAARQADIPWDLMYGMRNRVIHGYFEINTEVLWQTVHNDLPELRRLIEAAISGQNPDK